MMALFSQKNHEILPHPPGGFYIRSSWFVNMTAPEAQGLGRWRLAGGITLREASTL
jgi:hypothetical protein